MISLHIEASTAAEMREQLLGLVSMIQQGDAAANADAEAVATAKPARRKASDKPEPAPVEAKVEETPKRSVFDDDDATPAKSTVTKEQLQELAMAYAQKHNDDALAELVGKYSTTGKFSGIPEGSYTALHAELTA